MNSTKEKMFVKVSLHRKLNFVSIATDKIVPYYN